MTSSDRQAKPGKSSRGGDVFIVDNSDADWKVLQYLREWTEIAESFDIATGYFDIGSLVKLDTHWQKLDRIRILLGDEVPRRTQQALLDGTRQTTDSLDASLEREKLRNDFLQGVPAVVEALRRGQIACRVYRGDKFHAKAYITHGRLKVVPSVALVGSSNFTVPGLTENVELNIQILQEVDQLQDWYERHWEQGVDVSEEVLRVIERHTRDYSPFEVYAKALQEFFRSHELTASEWDLAQSKMYGLLDDYQREGYHSLIKIARKYGGAFLCDGVGLGKTFIGMMLIERLVEFDRKRVALFVPKAARKPVWEAKLNNYLKHITGGYSNLLIFNHTDLSREGEVSERLQDVAARADVIVIDEAHHFRNPGIKGEGERKPSRYRRMLEICKGKEVYMLTATPINNRLIDLQHMIELFSQQEPGYFSKAPLGIHSLPGHFRTLEKDLQRILDDVQQDSSEDVEVNQAEAEDVLQADRLFRELVVQRSRAYVKASQQQQCGAEALFPQREDPRVAEYSVKKTYGKLLDMVEKAFAKDKPLFALAMYYPLAYFKGMEEQRDALTEGRQKQVVGLIRTQFLKRFESSARAFEASCEALLLKLLAFFAVNSNTPAEKKRVERWMAQHEDLLRRVREHQPDAAGDEEDLDEDVLSPEMLEAAERLDPELYDVGPILDETHLDLDQAAQFLQEFGKLSAQRDDKLAALVRLLKNDPVLKRHKVLIFTEYMDTARYLSGELRAAGIEGVDEVHSKSGRDRGEIISQFSPYYNDTTSEELREKGLDETRVLVSTDVLSEGMNLQDATRLINYDLHWNPVRLMQRIGRVDRRLDPKVEAAIVAAHPDQKSLRGSVAYWNFLPPGELDDLLRLYQRVSSKTLRISKVFGIEGSKLLTPDDDYDAMKDFTHAYEGSTTFLEALRLEFQQLLRNDASLEGRLRAFPSMVFSGKEHPSSGARAVFLCYNLPGAPKGAPEEPPSADAAGWTEEAGSTAWYLYNVETEEISDDPAAIVKLIKSEPDTPRRTQLPRATLGEIRARVQKHIKNTYLKKVDAPVGVGPKLKCWMELS